MIGVQRGLAIIIFYILCSLPLSPHPTAQDNRGVSETSMLAADLIT